MHQKVSMDVIEGNEVVAKQYSHGNVIGSCSRYVRLDTNSLLGRSLPAYHIGW